MKSIKLSVVIITLNEEKDLPRCLESVSGLADEIVVVDSGSTDKTVEIARSYNAKVYVRKFDNYANQKNFASNMTQGEWLLALDADEEIEPELVREIKLLFSKEKKEYIAYSFPRKNIILGKLIRYSRWQPELDRHIWLWKKGFGEWRGDVHEELVANGTVGRLKNAKIHHQYDTVKEFIVMVDRYSEIEANQRMEKGERFSYHRLFFDPLYNFFVRFIYRLGFLDGWRGFVLSYLMGIYHFIVWIKVLGMQNNKIRN